MKKGKDVIIHGSVIFARPEFISIGSHVAIDPFVYITTAMELGNYIHIAPHVSIIGGKDGLLVMKDFSAVSAGCRLICSTDDYGGSGIVIPFIPKKYQSKHTTAPIVLEKFSVLGTNVVVLPGVTIGEGAAIGACSLVTKSVEPWTINVGVPSRAIQRRSKETILRYAKEIAQTQKK